MARKGEHVFVLTCNSRVQGIYAFQYDALRESSELKNYGYKNLKIEEFMIG